MTKDQILAALPKLKAAQLQEIQTVCQGLLGQNSAAKPEPGLWFAAISGALGSKLSYCKASQTMVGKHLNQHAKAAEEYLTKIRGKNSTRKLDHAASRRFMADLLVADLKQRGVTPTIGMLASNLSRLPEIMEAAFPGYVESNLTHLIFNRRKS